MTARRTTAALVVLLLAGAALGFVRETTVTSHPDQGRCLWWDTRTVKFKVNTTSAVNPPGGRATCANCEPCFDAAGAAALVASTVPAWSAATAPGGASACTDLALAYDGTTSITTLGKDGTNLVVVRTGWCFDSNLVPLSDGCRSSLGACAAKYNCWEHDSSGTLGLTTTTFDAGNGRILDADIELFGWDGATSGTSFGYYLTCAASPGCGRAPQQTLDKNCTYVDVASLSLHEAGHVLGLDHTCQYASPYDGCTAGSVMQPIIPTGTTRRALDADDVTGVCTIYPKGAATLTCGGSSSGGGSKSGGCGSAEGAGALGLLGAALALFGVRRRRR